MEQRVTAMLDIIIHDIRYRPNWFCNVCTWIPELRTRNQGHILMLEWTVARHEALFARAQRRERTSLLTHQAWRAVYLAATCCVVSSAAVATASTNYPALDFIRRSGAYRAPDIMSVLVSVGSVSRIITLRVLPHAQEHVRNGTIPISDQVVAEARRLVSSKNKQCAACDARQPRMSKCAACMLCWYCSPACQNRDWPEHKVSCPHLAVLAQHLKERANFTPADNDS